MLSGHRGQQEMTVVGAMSHAGGRYLRTKINSCDRCEQWPSVANLDAVYTLCFATVAVSSVCQNSLQSVSFSVKHTPLATRAPQMLLVPVDVDVGHADEANAGTNPRPSDGDGYRDPAMMSGVQPSKSLLAGVDFNDDDDEVTNGEVENDQSSYAAESFGHGGASAAPAEWEHFPPPGAWQAESVVSVQSAASQQEQEIVMPTSTGGYASSQRVFGKWRATNVLREGSVPGILYLFDESLVFESERNEIEDSEEATVTGLQQLAGQTWRWRLGRLTQVTHA